MVGSIVNTLALTAAGSWSIGNLLETASQNVRVWLGWIILIIGVAMIAFGIFKLAQGLMAKGQQQVQWATVIILIAVGTLLLVLGGASAFADDGIFSLLGGGMQQTVEDWGSGNVVGP